MNPVRAPERVRGALRGCYSRLMVTIKSINHLSDENRHQRRGWRNMAALRNRDACTLGLWIEYGTSISARAAIDPVDREPVKAEEVRLSNLRDRIVFDERPRCVQQTARIRRSPRQLFFGGTAKAVVGQEAELLLRRHDGRDYDFHRDGTILDVSGPVDPVNALFLRWPL